MLEKWQGSFQAIIVSTCSSIQRDNHLLLFIQDPRLPIRTSIRHRPNDHFGDLQTARAQIHILHLVLLLFSVAGSHIGNEAGKKCLSDCGLGL